MYMYLGIAYSMRGFLFCLSCLLQLSKYNRSSVHFVISLKCTYMHAHALKVPSECPYSHIV